MTVWFTSDSHFGHERIISLCNRPFRDVEHMNAELIRRWNEVVAPDDHVYHLGDVALGPIASSLPLIGRLNGHKTLITGNHDRTFLDPEAMEKKPEKHLAYAKRFYDEYMKYFNVVQMFGKVEDGVYHAAEMSLIPYIGVDLSNGTHSFDRALRMSHFPYTGDSHDKPRFDAIRPVDDGKVLLHGHTHQSNVITRSASGTLQVHVGVDSWSYAPVSLEQILELI